MEIKTTSFSIFKLPTSDVVHFSVSNTEKVLITIDFEPNQWTLFCDRIFDDSFDSWSTGVEQIVEKDKFIFKVIPPRGADHGFILLCINNTMHRMAIDYQELNMLRTVIRRGIPKKEKPGFFGMGK